MLKSPRKRKAHVVALLPSRFSETPFDELDFEDDASLKVEFVSLATGSEVPTIYLAYTREYGIIHREPGFLSVL